MVAALIRIVPLTPTAHIDPLLLRDLLWDCTTPGDGVEHLHIRAGPTGADIIAFIDTTSTQLANHTLHRLIQKAITRKPLLHLWRVL